MQMLLMSLSLLLRVLFPPTYLHPCYLVKYIAKLLLFTGLWLYVISELFYMCSSGICVHRYTSLHAHMKARARH